jgi:hypothetical protein
MKGIEEPAEEAGKERNNNNAKHHLDGDVEGWRAFWAQNFFVESQDVFLYLHPAQQYPYFGFRENQKQTHGCLKLC